MSCTYSNALIVLAMVRIAHTRSAHDHIDSGNCAGEFRSGNSEWIPSHYSIYLDLNPSLKVFDGNVRISGSLNYSISNAIDLHCVNLSVSRVAVDGTELNQPADWYVDEIKGLLRIARLPFDATSDVVNAILHISFKGFFNENTGVIMQNYHATDKTRWIIFTHLEPASARMVFPCIDLPKYKATFDISIRNPGPELVVLSNMPRKTSNSKIIKFQRTPLMSTYLVALVICDYEPVVPTGHHGKRRNITTWVPREMKKERYKQTSWVTDLTPRFLGALEKYTGSTYSLPKLDQFVVMDKPGIGGMENWGLIMYQVDSFIPSNPTANNMLRVVYSVVHELSHHWFGNSVTTADWCGMWFQEAIPTFLQGIIAVQEIKETDMVNRVKWMARKDVMDEECFFYDESSPLRDEEDPKSSNGDLFSLSRYFKGASVFYMIESLVKPNTLRKSLRSIIRKYNLSYVKENEIWHEVKSYSSNYHTPPLFDEVLGTWVTNRSHPIVYLQRNQNGTLRMGQRVCYPKYFLDGEWWIPITYTTNSSNPDFNDTSLKQWISPGSELQELGFTLKNDEWIVINVLGTGFYRVEYDDITWKILVDQLKRNHEAIPPINRAILLDDSFHTANTGSKLVKAFEILKYLPQEGSSYVWEGLLINMENHYKEAPDNVKVLLKKYLQYLLKTVFIRTITNTTLIWDRESSSNDRSLREPVFKLSYMMELRECFDFSIEIVMKIMNGSTNKTTIPFEIRSTLWCAAVARGPERVFQYVKDAFDSEEDEKEKALLFEQLQCSRNHTATLLELILKSNDGESKASLTRAVKTFLINHWPGHDDTCKEILGFIANNKMKLVDNDHELLMEFGNYLKGPPPQCEDQTKKIIGSNSISVEDGDSDQSSWEDVFGTEPLKWLEHHFKNRRRKKKFIRRGINIVKASNP